MHIFTLIATTPFGLEATVKRELQALGFDDLHAFNGYVEFAGDETAIMRANLWLRTADRVLIKVGQFHATTFDDLFEQTKALPWADLLPEDAEFPIEGRSVKSILSSVPACQRIVKKAIVESMKTRYPRSVFDETGSRYAIEVSIQKDEVLLTLDTSGAGLHKRGYRKLSATAPIKETLAAALILLSRWQPHRPFADPLCGSGTIAIEAAMIGRNIAPGLNRSFASEQWPLLSAGKWADLRAEAVAAINRDVELNILASDVNPDVLGLAEYHSYQAGVFDDIQISTGDVKNFRPTEPYGCLVSNPPYGERLGEQAQVEQLYQVMGRSLSRLDTWSFFIITSHPAFEKLFGKHADKKRKLYNGRIQTNFYQYLGPLPPRKIDGKP
jgi:putative N6-adenine-specific DNA methylase